MKALLFVGVALALIYVLVLPTVLQVMNVVNTSDAVSIVRGLCNTCP